MRAVRTPFVGGSPLRLLFLTAALAALWLSWTPPLSPAEQRLYDKVLAAQAFLWDELGRRGLPRDEGADPHHSGLIGLEWSVTTTTQGDLKAKRCATDPLWAVQMLRWFDELGLVKGDRVVVLASSSFPGAIYSVLAAAEARGLDTVLGVSLGASNWGANRPEAPWPVLSKALIDAGFLRTRPALCTLGGGSENGGGMPQEARDILTAAAQSEGLPLLVNGDLEEAVQVKMQLVREGRTRLVVSVGGPEGNMGDSPDVLRLPPGLILPRQDGGDGVIGRALREGYPVVHILYLRGMADACGVAWEARRPTFVRGRSVLVGTTGLLLFALVLATHRRWGWEGE